jgi:hypothetical protein
MAVWFRRCDSFEEEAAADREYWQQFTPIERVALIEDLKREVPMESLGTRDHGDLFEAFERHGVRALVVGAYAVAFHAKPRFTKDLDIFVEPTLPNGERIIRALTDFGFAELGLTANDFASSGRIIQLGFPPNRIDLITSIDGVAFESAWANRIEGLLGGRSAFFIGKEELILNKQTSARPMDLADVALLRSF